MKRPSYGSDLNLPPRSKWRKEVRDKKSRDSGDHVSADPRRIWSPWSVWIRGNGRSLSP